MDQAVYESAATNFWRAGSVDESHFETLQLNSGPLMLQFVNSNKFVFIK